MDNKNLFITTAVGERISAMFKLMIAYPKSILANLLALLVVVAIVLLLALAGGFMMGFVIAMTPKLGFMFLFGMAILGILIIVALLPFIFAIPTFTTIKYVVDCRNDNNPSVTGSLGFAMKNLKLMWEFLVGSVKYYLVPLLLILIGYFCILYFGLQAMMGGLGNGQDFMASGGLLAGIAGICILVGVIWMIVVGIKLMFSFYYAIENGTDGYVGVEKSMEITNGEFWTVVGNGIASGLVVFIVTFIIAFALSMVGLMDGIIGDIFDGIFQLLGGVLGTFFYYTLFLDLSGSNEINTETKTVNE